ncbi:MAG TPA: DUF4328 domain-containing protein [Pseudonocardia sp.]|nr:DUF4328 domain-containing protein [Pseudonocardia sp.]
MTAVPPPAGPMPPTAPVRPRPVKGLGTAIAVLAVATWLASIPLFTDGWTDYLRLSDHVSGQLSEDEYWDHYFGRVTSMLVFTALALPVSLAGGISWLVWVHRARTNAGLVSPHHRFRYSPGFSVGGLLVPFANLWWSRPILEDICTGSSPYAPAHRAVRLVRTWWALLVTTTVVSITGSIAIPVPTLTYSPDGQLVSGGSEALDAFFAVALLDTLLAVLGTASLALLVMVTRWVSGQQTALLFAPRQA